MRSLTIANCIWQHISEETAYDWQIPWWYCRAFRSFITAGHEITDATLPNSTMQWYWIVAASQSFWELRFTSGLQIQSLYYSNMYTFISKLNILTTRSQLCLIYYTILPVLQRKKWSILTYHSLMKSEFNVNNCWSNSWKSYIFVNWADF